MCGAIPKLKDLIDTLAPCTPIILGGDSNKKVTKDKCNSYMSIHAELSLY